MLSKNLSLSVGFCQYSQNYLWSNSQSDLSLAVSNKLII
jgi:hypothetical protein